MADSDLLRILEKPELRSPVFILGFAGWTNAAEAASGAVGYLKDRLHAKKFAEMDAEAFYQYTATRPTVSIRDGVLQALSYPGTQLYYWQDPQERQDAIVLIGAEPDLRWPTYTALITDLAKELAVSRMFIIGAFFDSVPHTRDILCTGGSDDATLAADLRRVMVEPTSYAGPTGIHSALLMAAKEKGIPAASVWARAPHYIQTSNAHVMHGALWRIVGLTRLPVDLVPLQKRGQDMVKQVDEAMQSNPKLREHVRELEAMIDAQQPSSPDVPGEPLHQEDILRSVEDFFRQNPDQRS